MDQLFAILRTLNRHRYKLTLIPLFTMVLIYYFTSGTPKKYRTEAKLYLNLQEGKGMSLTDEDLKQYQVQTYFTNTIELLKADKTIENVKLKAIARALANEGFFAAGNERLIKNKEAVATRIASLKNSTADLKPSSFPDSLIIRYMNYHQLFTNRLKDQILSFRIMDSNFVKLEFSENTPQKTQELAQLFIDALMQENRELAKKKIKGHKDIIESLVRQSKTDLDTKIKKLEHFKISNSIINLGEHTKAIVVYLVQLEGQRANLFANVAAGHKGKTEVLSTVNNGNAIILDVSENEEILRLKTQLRAMNKEMLVEAFEKNTVVSDGVIHKNMQATKEQIQAKILELTRKTSFDPSRVQLDLVSRYMNYDLEAETSADMIGIINAEIERVTKYSKRFAPFESTIGAYEQEISTAQNAYLVLLNKLNLTQTMEYGAVEDVVETIDPPYLPVKPEASKRMIIVAAGGISVFVLMAAVFIVIQLLDASIATVEKFEKESKLPVIAALPMEDAGRDRSHLADSITMVHQQQSFKLLQNVIAKCIGEQGILLLLSSQKGEGKHYVAAHLQDLLRKAGKKVAFADADWMTTASHENFISFKEKISNQGLIANRQEIIAELTRMREENDLVVVIASPVNLSAEAEFWMEICKHVLYVFKANRLITKVDKRVEDMLLKTRLQFLGTVINQLNIENMEDYLGEIPRRRNIVRVVIKKILTRNF